MSNHVDEFGAQPPPPHGAVPPAAPPKTSGSAVASLILSLLGIFCCGVTAFIGVILGLISMGSIRRSEGRLTGRGLALAGVIIGLLVIVGYVVAVIAGWPMIQIGINASKSAISATETGTEFLGRLQAKDYEGALALTSERYRADHTAEDLRRAVEAVGELTGFEFTGQMDGNQTWAGTEDIEEVEIRARYQLTWADKKTQCVLKFQLPIEELKTRSVEPLVDSFDLED